MVAATLFCIYPALATPSHPAPAIAASFCSLAQALPCVPEPPHGRKLAPRFVPARFGPQARFLFSSDHFNDGLSWWWEFSFELLHLRSCATTRSIAAQLAMRSGRLIQLKWLLCTIVDGYVICRSFVGGGHCLPSSFKRIWSLCLMIVYVF